MPLPPVALFFGEKNVRVYEIPERSEFRRDVEPNRECTRGPSQVQDANRAVFRGTGKTFREGRVCFSVNPLAGIGTFSLPK